MTPGGVSSMVQVYIVVMLNALCLKTRLDDIKCWFMKGLLAQHCTRMGTSEHKSSSSSCS
jgi:hypothetical protein